MFKNHFSSPTISWEIVCVNQERRGVGEWRAVLPHKGDDRFRFWDNLIFLFCLYAVDSIFMLKEFKIYKNSDIYVLYYSLTEYQESFNCKHWL